MEYLLVFDIISKGALWTERDGSARAMVMAQYRHTAMSIDLLTAYTRMQLPQKCDGKTVAADALELRVTLNNIEELFAEPAADPFDPDSRYQSGIDELAAHLRLRPRELDRKSRLVIHLPRMALDEESEPMIRAALDRYCAAKIAENRQVIGELRTVSRRQAASAIVAGIALILGAALLVVFVPELERFAGAIAGFVGIAIWVILWDPVWNYVYAWRPNRLNIQVYENLRDSELRVDAM